MNEFLSPQLAGYRRSASNMAQCNLSEEDALALMAAANAIVLLLRKITMNNTSDPTAWSSGYRQLYGAQGAEPARTFVPPIPIQESIAHDYIICFEDGARVKSLTSYLKRFDLTPKQYRAKWGLPPSYPMVAPELSERRSATAQKIKPHLNRKSARGNKTTA